MFLHNLLIIYRNFKRYKTTFFINLIGLSTGLACALLIYLWVTDELSVDKFNANDNRLYQVMENQKQNDGIATQEYTPDPLAENLAKDIPEVEYAAAVTPNTVFGKFALSVMNKTFKAEGNFAGKDFFNIFSYRLIEGDKNQVLAPNNSIVISRQLAMKIFKTTHNAVGKNMDWELIGLKFHAVVTGVFEDVPANASRPFDFIISFGAWKDLCKVIGRAIDWDNHFPDTFVLLKKGTSINQFNNKIAGYHKSKLSNSAVTLFARPFSSGYLYNKYENGVQSGGRIEYVRLFSIIALFILFIACINFMNLSTAKASRKMKEVGIKKAVGAPRKSLVFQYMGESILISFISMILAIVIVELLLPQFNVITGKQLALNINESLLLSVIGIALFTGILAGSYPALYLSGFKPAAVLKGKLNGGLGELWARKGLVVFQFTLSVIFIVAVLVVYNQMEFIQNKNIGFTKDNIIYFDKEGKAAENLDAFLAELKNVPGITNASSINQKIIGVNSTTIGLYWKGKNPKEVVQFVSMNVNYDLPETAGMIIKEGRTFSRNYGADSLGIIFNEASIKVMGLTNPIGKQINLWGQNRTIIGVVKDFNFESLHENVKPLFMILEPKHTTTIMAKIAAGKEKETIDNIQKFYQKYNPGYAFDFKFLDQDYQKQYLAEQRVAVLSRYFAGIAIIISCLGLFGLAAFTAERRRKEISIRKVLGSSGFGIVYLLSLDFTKLVFVSVVIALPASYLITKSWLDSFAYKISLNPWYFVTAGLAALLISWLTVALQAVKAAAVNPINSLKYE